MSSEDTDRSIERCKEKIARLAVLFSQGEISEESYKNSVKAIEDDIDRLRRRLKISTATEYRAQPIHVCEKCKQEFAGTRCPYCGTEPPRLPSPTHVCIQCEEEFIGTRCPRCGREVPPVSYHPMGNFVKRPTALWFLVPLLFGFLGGIVAYVGVKGDDVEMADGLLIFGIIWTFILAILGWVFILR